MGGPSVRVFLLVLLVTAVLLFAGCVAKKDDPKEEVLRSWSRDKPSDTTPDLTFDVPRGAERIRIVVSTEPPDDGGGFDWTGWSCPPGTAGCPDGSGDDTPSGTISMTVWDPANELRARFQLEYDGRDSKLIQEPAAGQWLVKISYRGYDGPIDMKVTEPVTGGGGLGGSFWDILGVFLALGMASGGWVLYRRRRNHLSRQLDQIDSTFRNLSDDVNECRANLIQMKEQLALMLRRNKLEESQFLILEKHIDQYLRDLETPGNRHATGDRAPKEGKALERLRRPSK